ncbi:MAG: NADPH-dependent oxidoreductase [Bacteroidales bacterium]|nr:NADPH-dependent oxidoreductase [Bacteroidales bacterium]
MNFSVTDQYFSSRRTIRRYSDKVIPEALLYKMLELASHAPTTGNMQLYSVIISSSREIREALAPLHFNQPQILSAPVILTFCADFNRFSKWCEFNDAVPCYDNLQSFVASAIDTIALAQQFNTIAEAYGLGVCWIGTTTYTAPKIAEVLELPSLVVPLITLTVGYPAEEGSDVGRLPTNAFIHSERYQDYSPLQIKELYSEKEERSDSKQFVEENQKNTLAQVFTDIRYPRANNEHFSEVFRDFLRDAGFVK